MKLFLEKRDGTDEESVFEFIPNNLPNTAQGKSNFENYPLKEGEIIREHLCDHDEEQNSEFKQGCKVNEKEKKNGQIVTRKTTLHDWFTRWNDDDIGPDGLTERQRFAKKVDGRITV